ncbi:MAG TPA: hypothetical protein VFT60_13310 [Bryobacteraceae bacterium]|nr:hypothetical protein [Bryobacteraceae bacterium]
MPPRITKKQRVQEYAAVRGWRGIGETEWNELRRALPDVSEATIQASGLTVEAPWSEVRQHSFEDLEESLRAFSGVYAVRVDLRRLCRDRVIAAKDRARWIARRAGSDEGLRSRKAEMVEWMLVWLGDPAVFPVWADAWHAARNPPTS